MSKAQTTNKVCIDQFVKSQFLQKKNHNFFVKQVIKIIVIPLNQEHFGLHIMKKKFQNMDS